jgi:phytoene desaturase
MELKDTNMANITIIGAGPGGLAAGLILVHQGHQVTLYEKDDRPGGRSKRLTFGNYHFDSGPTFFMYMPMLEHVFELAGIKLSDHIKFEPIDPLYALYFKDQTLRPSQDHEQTKHMMESLKPGSGKKYEKWYQTQAIKFQKMKPILEKPFPNFFHFLRPDVLAGAPHLHPFQSVYTNLKKIFKDKDDENFIHMLSFQAKYLGMASYEAPSVFTMLPYLEHHGGLYHVKGGLSQMNETMAKLLIEKGGILHYNSKVDKLILENNVVKGVEVSGNVHLSDAVVMNEDFAYAMTSLVKDGDVKRYSYQKIHQMKYSVSAFMLYVGLNQKVNLDHHNVFFSDDYEHYLKRLMSKSGDLSDMSFYVHNPSLMDDTLAPKGHSALYILVPLPNLDAPIDWTTSKTDFIESIYDRIQKRTKIDIRPMITQSHTLSPLDWQNDYHVFKGAVFNLSHGFDQMLHKRPQNKFKPLKNMYLVGGGTHPGSGLPTIYQSAIITSQYLKEL